MKVELTQLRVEPVRRMPDQVDAVQPSDLLPAMPPQTGEQPIEMRRSDEDVRVRADPSLNSAPNQSPAL